MGDRSVPNRDLGATPSACGQDVPDTLVEKAAQALAEAQVITITVHDQIARHVLAAVLPDATADLRARLQAADDRLAEVRREVAEEIAAAMPSPNPMNRAGSSEFGDLCIERDAYANARRIAREVGERP